MAREDGSPKKEKRDGGAKAKDKSSHPQLSPSDRRCFCLKTSPSWLQFGLLDRESFCRSEKGEKKSKAKGKTKDRDGGGASPSRGDGGGAAAVAAAVPAAAAGTAAGGGAWSSEPLSCLGRADAVLSAAADGTALAATHD